MDFLFGDVAVEAKAKTHVGARDMKGVKALREEGACAHYVIVCLEPAPRRVDGVSILPWTDFLERLWAGAWSGSVA